MSRYDGLIIPRSYSEYLNKTDSATLSQMLQHLTGLWSHAVSAGDNNPVTSDAVYEALTDAATIQQALQLPGVLSGAVADGDNKAVKSSAVYEALANYTTKSDLAEFTKIPYLSFKSTSKAWTWHVYNRYNTNKPIVNGQLVAIFIEDYLKGKYWSGTTTGVVAYALQNTNGEKSAETKCIGIVVDTYIDIIS